MTYIPGWGNSDAKLMIIGESPAPNDRRALENNRELQNMLSELGISFSDVWKTNVCKEFVPPSPVKGKKIPFSVRAKHAGLDIHKMCEELRTEINSLKPNCVLALGSTALWATTGKSGKQTTKKDKTTGAVQEIIQGGISNFRGSILWGPGVKVVSTYNPAELLSYSGAEFKGYYNRAVMRHDIRRAFEQSLFPDLRRPIRNLEICKSAYQFTQFLDRHNGAKRPAVDIEARGRCLPNCVGIAFTPQSGITIPLWNDDEMTAIYPISNSEMARIWIILSNVLANNDVVGQNFKYDQDKLIRLGFTIRSLFSDTLLKSFAINPELPKSLAFLTSIYTEEPYYKDEGMYEGALSELMMGCARDACVTKEIDLKQDADLDEVDGREYYENFILDLHQFYLDIDNEGMNVDSTVRDTLFEKYINWSENLQHELYTIVGESININSPKQVAVLLYENFKIPPRKGTGEEVLTDILNLQTLKLTPDKRRALEIILEQRRVEKTISTYLAALPDYDGKMRTTYFPCLDTGRSSTGQLDPPTRPSIDIVDAKGLKKTKPIGIAFQTMTKHGDIGADVRSQYVPDPGYVFIQADSAQAEARVVWLLADDEDALRLVDTVDYHALTATWFFGENAALKNYDKKALGYEHPIRFVGKTLRHAGHLGAQKKRAAATVNTDARKFKIILPNGPLKESDAERHLKTFHRMQPKIQKNFHNGIIEALNRDQRRLRSGVPFGINARKSSPRQFLERWGDELFRQAFSYIPQRSVSDNTKSAGLRLKKREPKLARIIMESHDALLLMVPEREADYLAPIIREEMERPIRFDECSLSRRDLVIPCDVEIGDNYMDFKKYKFATESVAPVVKTTKNLYEEFYGS